MLYLYLCLSLALTTPADTVVILGLDDNININSTPITTISYRHPFSYTLDESVILDTLRNAATAHGANLVRIVEDKHPTRYFRGKVTAEFFAVDNPGQYEPKTGKCEFYLITPGPFKTVTRCDPRSQRDFELCELYRRRLDTALRTDAHLNFFTRSRRSAEIYRIIYAAYLQNRSQPDSVILPFPALPNHQQLDQAAHELRPPDTNALVYIIRPNQYNTPVYKRIAYNPWLLCPCPEFLFLNPDRYVINCKGLTQGPIGVNKFIYRYLPADTCTITSNQGDFALTLTLNPGKTYYVKMKPVIVRFGANPAASYELLTESAGTRYLRKSRLSRHWEDFKLPEYPDPLH